MGLFGRKSKEEAMVDAARLAEGRGIAGKLTGAFIGKENMGRLRDSVHAAQNAQVAQQATAAGFEMAPATVVALQDTGKLVNFDPIVMLTVALTTGQQLTMETLVSKLQIPRPGDTVGLLPNPQAPGQYMYAGPYAG